MLIEVMTFRLARDEAAFLEADHELQAALSPQDGFLRRTTARGANGEWAVVTLWHSAEEADAPRPSVDAFDTCIRDVLVKRYEDIGG